MVAQTLACTEPGLCAVSNRLNRGSGMPEKQEYFNTSGHSRPLQKKMGPPQVLTLHSESISAWQKSAKSRTGPSGFSCATVNRSHHQSEFDDPKPIQAICDDSKVQLIRKLCTHSGLR